MDGCGGAILWTDAPDLFACRDNTGEHLRNLQDPTRNVGAAGPPGDLPILKVGHSLWVAAYHHGDWSVPSKSLALRLVELGSGKQLTVSVPGR